MPLPGPLKNFLRGQPRSSASGGSEPPGRVRKARPDEPDVITTRRSRALEEFFIDIREQSGLTILDLGGASQENVNFITNLGHRLYSEDFLQILHETFGSDGTVDHSNPGRIDFFLRQALDLILQPHGLESSIQDNVLRVHRHQMQTRIFNINYVATRRSGSRGVGSGNGVNNGTNLNNQTSSGLTSGTSGPRIRMSVQYTVCAVHRHPTSRRPQSQGEGGREKAEGGMPKGECGLQISGLLAV